jgi:hypothetical protein
VDVRPPFALSKVVAHLRVGRNAVRSSSRAQIRTRRLAKRLCTTRRGDRAPTSRNHRHQPGPDVDRSTGVGPIVRFPSRPTAGSNRNGPPVTAAAFARPSGWLVRFRYNLWFAGTSAGRQPILPSTSSCKLSAAVGKSSPFPPSPELERFEQEPMGRSDGGGAGGCFARAASTFATLLTSFADSHPLWQLGVQLVPIRG